MLMIASKSAKRLQAWKKRRKKVAVTHVDEKKTVKISLEEQSREHTDGGELNVDGESLVFVFGSVSVVVGVAAATPPLEQLKALNNSSSTAAAAVERSGHYYCHAVADMKEEEEEEGEYGYCKNYWNCECDCGIVADDQLKW